MDLAFIDKVLIALYIPLVIIIGIIYKSREDSEDFLIAGRKLGFLSSCMTISASKVGAGLLLTYSALVFTHGFSALWLFVGYIFGYFIFYFFAYRLKNEAEIHKFYTMSDYFKEKYGIAASYFISVLVLLSMFGWILTNLIGGGKIFSLISGFTYPTSIILVAVVIIIYLFIGGFASVVKTDFLQYISIIFVFIILLLVISKGDILTTSFTKLEQMKAGNLAVFFLSGVLFPLGSAELWQRVYATKTIKDLKKSLIAASSMYIVLGLVLSLICLKVSSLPSIEQNDEFAIVKGLGVLLPAGFSGLFVIALFSAIMSSADTFIFTTSSAFAQDFLQNIFKLNSEATIKILKYGILLFTILAVIFSLLIKSIVNVTFLFAALTLTLGIISLGSWIKSDISPLSIKTAVIGNVITVIIVLLIFGIDLKLVAFSILAAIIFLIIGQKYSKFYIRFSNKKKI